MRVLWLTGVIVALDQATKMLVVQTMYRSQSIPLIGDWLSLTYTENPGMAFGITFGPKSLITYFSIFATAVIIFYLISIRKGYAPYRTSLALVLGGALGNIIDRVFYGALIYGEPFFQGRVVDFIHVNVWRGYLPDSIPLLGGKYIALFPIWNVADMSIVVGVVGILVFQKAFHSRQARSDAKVAFQVAEGVPVPVPEGSSGADFGAATASGDGTIVDGDAGRAEVPRADDLSSAAPPEEDISEGRKDLRPDDTAPPPADSATRA
ncbi:MAG: signal peptidase II [Rhodothermia bacterium]|nr:signal peptidase II [Rhodothermia bacterium]